MKRAAILGAVVLFLVICSFAEAAEEPKPAGDKLAVNPFRRVEKPKPAGPLDRLASYIGNRFRDLADIVTLKLGFGTDKSLGFQLRLCRPLQIGAGVFEGWVLAFDRGCVGTMKEAEVEAGFSIFYPSWIARKVYWQNGEAKRRNAFFGDVGEKGDLSFKELITPHRLYDDENQAWFNSTFQVQGPYLPKFELTIHWGEIPDFFLGILSIDRFRVPPPFHKKDGPKDAEGKSERIPAPSIHWHGQEEFESYE